MALIKTIVNSNELYHALRQTDSYKNSFSYDGAMALQLYLDDVSEQTNEDIEFDPIAWACEYTEYESYDDFQQSTGYTQNGVHHNGYEDIHNLDELKDYTEVIEFDNGIIVRDF